MAEKKPVEVRRPPRDDEEAAAFRGMGQAVTVIRERRGMSRDDLATKAEMSVPELEDIERGELDEGWGGLRMIAKAFGMSLPGLMMEAEEFAPGKGGEDWRRSAGEAESDSAIPGVRSDAAEGGKGQQS
jgi:ribosome-binding protein aMBF1 (putative translation factor)